LVDLDTYFSPSDPEVTNHLGFLPQASRILSITPAFLQGEHIKYGRDIVGFIQQLIGFRSLLWCFTQRAQAHGFMDYAIDIEAATARCDTYLNRFNIRVPFVICGKCSAFVQVFGSTPVVFDNTTLQWRAVGLSRQTRRGSCNRCAKRLFALKDLKTLGVLRTILIDAKFEEQWDFWKLLGETQRA
jgi:hypothetical protein